MDNKNLMPVTSQPVNRITTGQLPSELAELSEEALSQLAENVSSSASVRAAVVASLGTNPGAIILIRR
jgi:bacteriocin leader peptide (microcyclamide/patellamide family)